MTEVRTLQATYLSNNEIGLLKALLRAEIRKMHRKHEHNAVKFAKRYDPARVLARIAFLEGTYRTLGGDPAEITDEDED